MNRATLITILLLGLISGTLLGVSMTILFYKDEITSFNCTQIERYKLYEKVNMNRSIYVNGIAHKDDYYCVWTKDRKPESIASTEVHEKCHILIAKNNTHFCGKPKNINISSV